MTFPGQYPVIPCFWLAPTSPAELGHSCLWGTHLFVQAAKASCSIRQLLCWEKNPFLGCWGSARASLPALGVLCRQWMLLLDCSLEAELRIRSLSLCVGNTGSSPKFLPLGWGREGAGLSVSLYGRGVTGARRSWSQACCNC